MADQMQTRSKTCRRTKDGPCRRLTGHKGDCRPMLTKSAMRQAKAEPTPKVTSPKVSRKATGQCRVSRNGERCLRQLGHKAAGKRHRFGPKVRTLPMADSTRVVGAPSKTVKTERFHVSSKPSARLA